MKHIIKKILKEDINDKVINIVLNRLESGKIKPPYILNLQGLGLTDDEIKTTLEQFFGGKMIDKEIYSREHGGDLYNEWGDGNWSIHEYNKIGYITNMEQSDGYWQKREYDEMNNKIYFEESTGFWYKNEYDDRGNLIYFENSNGSWASFKYDKNNKLINRETGIR